MRLADRTFRRSSLAHANATRIGAWQPLKARPLIPIFVLTMHRLVKANLTPHIPDARLYLALGIATWSIFVTHIPNNVVNLLTMRNFGFSGPADLFVFVVGYGVTIIHGRMALERGFIVAATRIFRRVWGLYAA